MKISSYHSAFNLIKMNFDYEYFIENYCSIFDEVVVAVNVSEDQTLNILCDLASQKYPNKLKVYPCDYSYQDIDFDGKIKNYALSKCTNEICTLLDLDEEIPLYHKELWYDFANILKYSDFDAYLFPVVNLCGDKYHYKDIGYKWRLHKRNGYFRGIVNFAKISADKINIEQSDTTELIDKNGNLVKSHCLPNTIEDLRSGDIPFVFHHYGDNIEQRNKQNEFWQPVWSNRAKNNIVTVVPEDIRTFEHKLKI